MGAPAGAWGCSRRSPRPCRALPFVVRCGCVVVARAVPRAPVERCRSLSGAGALSLLAPFLAPLSGADRSMSCAGAWGLLAPFPAPLSGAAVRCPVRVRCRCSRSSPRPCRGAFAVASSGARGTARAATGGPQAPRPDLPPRTGRAASGKRAWPSTHVHHHKNRLHVFVGCGSGSGSGSSVVGSGSGASVSGVLRGCSWVGSRPWGRRRGPTTTSPTPTPRPPSPTPRPPGRTRRPRRSPTRRGGDSPASRPARVRRASARRLSGLDRVRAAVDRLVARDGGTRIGAGRVQAQFREAQSAAARTKPATISRVRLRRRRWAAALRSRRLCPAPASSSLSARLPRRRSARRPRGGASAGSSSGSGSSSAPGGHRCRTRRPRPSPRARLPGRGGLLGAQRLDGRAATRAGQGAVEVPSARVAKSMTREG